MLEAIRRFFAVDRPADTRIRAVIPEVCLGHFTMLKMGETATVDRELAELLIYKGQAERV